MRNITQLSVLSFNANEKFSNNNTVIKIEDNVTKLLLHGNLIAGKDSKGFFIDSCGYLTNTTKERLNGLDNVSIMQKRGVWYLNGNVWDGKKIYVSNF
jgi:ligand-binding sensor protein